MSASGASHGMLTCSIEQLYVACEVRGGLRRQIEFEQFANDMRATAGTHAQPLIAPEGDDGAPVSGFAPTVPCKGGVRT